MKRSILLGLSAVALVVTVPFLGESPVSAQFKSATQTLVEAIRRPQVELNLVADKKRLEVDETGKETITWESLGTKAVVQPGDVLRYSISSKNQGDVAAQNLVVTQPVPDKTVYELGSAKSNNSAKITYSIDNGQTFVANPMVKVTLPDGTVEERPAPAEVYTHVRWQFGQMLNPESGVNASYEVTVR